MKRIFLAVDVHTEEIAAELEAIRNALPGGKINWIHSPQMHITLKFFGNTEEEEIQRIAATLPRTAASFSQFRLFFAGLGVFRNPARPHVIWIGCRNPEPLVKLKVAMDHELESLGYEAEKRKYAPHLTIGRIKAAPAANDLKILLEKFRDHDFFTQLVAKVVLYESRLKPEGPEYIPLKTFGLREKV